ncbi:hypothetical protein EDB89DRAFT_2077970 [Lactarius sanguifluus]|nr:hypothetical protein EDB89DRAFT_2077970 [Lactarius sanguifluus]
MAPKLSIVDIDGYITFLQNSLSLYPRSHSVHIICVQTLAMVRFSRHELLQRKEDLDKCVVHFTEANFLPPVSRAGLSLNVIKLLFHLAIAHLHRFENFEQPEDVRYSIEYLRYLRGLPLDSFDVPRNFVMTLLIRALGIQVESEAGNGARNIKEMVVLCCKLLTTEVSTDFFATAFPSLNNAVDAEVDRGRSVQSIDEVVECLQCGMRWRCAHLVRTPSCLR